MSSPSPPAISTAGGVKGEQPPQQQPPSPTRGCLAGEEREVNQRSLPTGVSVAGISINAPAVDSSRRGGLGISARRISAPSEAARC